MNEYILALSEVTEAKLQNLGYCQIWLKTLKRAPLSLFGPPSQKPCLGWPGCRCRSSGQRGRSVGVGGREYRPGLVNLPIHGSPSGALSRAQGGWCPCQVVW